MPVKIMRILLSILFSCLLLTACSFAESSSAFEYALINETEAKITRCNVAAGEIKIPAEIDGYKITAIGDGAFEDCHSISGEIVIPEGVTSVGDSAFFNCWNLTGAVLPDSLESLGSMAFGMCYRLRSADLGSIEEIPYMAFAYCRSLESITIPEGCASIGGMAFESCSNLEHILIPDSVRTIGGINRYGKAAIYCNSGSAAEAWAKSEGWEVVLLDGRDESEYRRLSLGDDFTLNTSCSCMLPVNVFPCGSRGSVTFESSAPEIISVDETGRLTAHQPGSAVITAYLGSLSDSVAITAAVPVEDFTILPASVDAVSGETIQFSVKTSPENSGGEVLWHSTDNSVITIGLYSGTATVQGRGTAEITALLNGIERRIPVDGFEPVDSVAFAQDAYRVRTGGSARLRTMVTAGEDAIVNRLVTFSSSDESVATVDSEGTVYGHSEGSAVITASHGELSARCTVEVYANHLVLPDDLTRIAAEAFAGLSVEEIRLGGKVEQIESRAFADNAALVRINMPDSVRSIAADAFANCPNLALYCQSYNYAVEFARANNIPYYIEGEY